MANETPDGLVVDDPYPWNAPQEVQTAWAARHPAAVSIGVWIDAEGRGCVRTHVATKMPVALVAIALELIHDRLDQMIRVILKATDESDEPAHSC